MAIGDKKPVVMQSDRAVPSGIATLGIDGKLLDAQIPVLAKLGAAPAGYGYGDIPVLLYFNDDTDGTKLEASLDEILNGMPDGSVKQVRISDYPAIDGLTYIATLFKHKPDYVAVSTFSYTGAAWRKEKLSGTWLPHEWVNPPMTPGAEYRTTERYNGKPVYVKVVNFGALPAGGDRGEPHGISSLTGTISIELVGTNDKSVFTNYQGVAGIYSNVEKVHVVTSANLSSISVNAVIKYVK